MNYNKAIIAGNLTRDPESKTLPNGQPVANFSVASNRRYTDKEGNRQQTTEFHNIVAFGKWADICSQYLKKGMPVLMEGRLRTNSWQGQDGVKRYRTDIIMEFMQMGPRSAGSGSPSPAQASDQTEKPEQTISQEEIPVIEAEEPIEKQKEPVENQEEQNENPENKETEASAKTISAPESKEEVDVKNIPF